jgi:tetratricopeptide (TPR) repeat protein
MAMACGVGMRGMLRAMAIALLLLLIGRVALAANAIETLSAEISQAVQSGRNAEGLALAQKLEGLVRRQQGTDNMNYAGVLHNQGMFLHNLGRYQEAADKLNAALAIKLRRNDPASALRTSGILCASLTILGRSGEAMSVAQRALASERRRSAPTIHDSPSRCRRWARWRANRKTTRMPSDISSGRWRSNRSRRTEVPRTWPRRWITSAISTVLKAVSTTAKSCCSKA